MLIGNSSLSVLNGLHSPKNNETTSHFTPKALQIQLVVKPDEAHYNATVSSYAYIHWGNEYGQFLRLFAWFSPNLNGNGAWSQHLATWDKHTGRYEYNQIVNIPANVYFLFYFDWHYRTYKQKKSCWWNLTGKHCAYTDTWNEWNDYNPNIRNFDILMDVV